MRGLAALAGSRRRTAEGCGKLPGAESRLYLDGGRPPRNAWNCILPTPTQAWRWTVSQTFQKGPGGGATVTCPPGDTGVTPSLHAVSPGHLCLPDPARTSPCGVVPCSVHSPPSVPLSQPAGPLLLRTPRPHPTQGNRDWLGGRRQRSLVHTLAGGHGLRTTPWLPRCPQPRSP